MERYEYTIKQNMEMRLTEIQSILENNLYENEQEEMELMNERGYIEIELIRLNHNINIMEG
jgi:hypothetical protein